ncbi:MAG: diadenylate cyclase CdaA [Bacteroidales bacterium]|nr:diadenylate cyclase CdaA [Bacteroidales bacterium]MBN2818312.1 diadenylate cyclase CdaA [Bacteroidales bacterium]
MITAFIHVRIIDVIDILLVAFLMYQIYYLIKGTVAFNIFLGLTVFFSIYLIVNMLQMKLLSSILGGLIGGGVIAIIILFQQEIRRFLVYLGTQYLPNKTFSLDNLLRRHSGDQQKLRIASIHKACSNMAETCTGALIVIAQNSSLDLYVDTGDILDARMSSRMIESVFVKNGPLHDGAIIVENNRIVAARCVLPFTSKTELPAYYGMRHRAGLGISESTDAYVIIVSEERGEISIAENGDLIPGISADELWHLLKKKFDKD